MPEKKMDEDVEEEDAMSYFEKLTNDEWFIIEKTTWCWEYAHESGHISFYRIAAFAISYDTLWAVVSGFDIMNNPGLIVLLVFVEVEPPIVL